MPSSARAALWIAGERECPTGWPTTARRRITVTIPSPPAPRSRSAGRRRVAARFFAGLVVAGDVFFEFGFGLGEGEFVAGAGLRHVEEVVGLGGMRGRFDRSQPGVPDRPRWQAAVGPGVVGG